MKILLCFGTRPEAIKMAPLFHELKRNNLGVKICVTAQHREMLDQVLAFFEIKPDFDLNLMKPNQTLNGLSAGILLNIDKVLEKERPDLVLVHGDTTTSAMVSLAAFHLGIRVGHVEAGLRTYNKQNPFPEEINRQITARIADFHFAPTKKAVQNLLDEKIPEGRIVETGNTVIDALLWTVDKIKNDAYRHPEIERLKTLIPLNKKMILITGHRREAFGEGLDSLCAALQVIAKRSDVAIVFPVHLNPQVKQAVYRTLAEVPNIYLLPPAPYPVFIWLMQQAFMIVTDSGGIQEEAPTLGKPVLVTRKVSERPEGIEAGFSTLIGNNPHDIIEHVNRLIEGFEGFKDLRNPYGDGTASYKIAGFIKKQLLQDE